MTRFRELPATIVGQIGEQIVARQWKRDGWGVIASYKFSGANDNEAPAIEIDDEEREITPDLDASKGGKRIWIEVKTHAKAAPNHKLGISTHGIPVRLYDNYIAVEQRSGNPVFLAIVQMDTREILVSPRPISNMMKFECLCGCRSRKVSTCSAGPAGRYPQWYFDKAEFEVRGHIDAVAFKILDEKHVELLRSHARARHGSSRTSSPENIFTKPVPPWTWTCLPCNVTGVGDSSKHRCADAAAWRRDFWVQRFRWVMPAASQAELAEMITRPIDRAKLASILGDKWLVAGDVR